MRKTPLERYAAHLDDLCTSVLPQISMAVSLATPLAWPLALLFVEEDGCDLWVVVVQLASDDEGVLENATADISDFSAQIKAFLGKSLGF